MRDAHKSYRSPVLEGLPGVLLSLLLLTGACSSPVDRNESTAEQILEATGVSGGLIVHLGCGDGALTVSLRRNESYVVHGLDTDAENIAKARERIYSLGAYGPVSVDTFDGAHLPYADNLVNLIVAENLAEVSADELKRVLAPGAVAYVREGELARNAKWTTIPKPWPELMDEWTHHLHDASNNAVASDQLVGSPRQLRWTAGPLWSRSHEYISSLSAMVSGGGRLFYVFDEGITSVTDGGVPERWTLTARDAFSGVLLWARPLREWRGSEWTGTGLRARPGSVPRRLVVDGEQLFVTLSHRDPVSILSCATGETLRTIDGTESAQEFVLAGRTLVARLAPTDGTGKQLSGSMVAVDADSGAALWSVAAQQFEEQSLAADEGRVIYGDGKGTVCLNLTDGEELWRVDSGSPRLRRGSRTFILHGDFVVEGDSEEVIVRSAASGETLWSVKDRGGSMQGYDLFIARGCVWCSSARGITGYEVATGRQVKVIDPSSVQSPGHHLRCYRAKATDRFLITQFRGAEFISLTDEEHFQNDWIRGSCRYGILPANGLLYVPPDPCFCYPGVKLNGFNAFSSGIKATEQVGTSADRLERGPVYSEVRSPSHGRSDGPDWPMYRHDPRRSGATSATVSPEVAVRWQVQLRGKLTPPVSAADRVFVAAKDQHTLYAIRAEDGEELWHFTAGGRIDSPPTLHGELVLFGCVDGYVYCLRASDGKVAWRFRAAPVDRRIVAFGQVESPWRVHGSVLVKNGLVYCTAGRSSFLDGGIRVYALDPATGSIMHETHLDTWSRTRADAEDKPFIPAYHMEGTHSDILVSEGDFLYLGQYKFDSALQRQELPYVLKDPKNPVTAMDLVGTPFTAEDSFMGMRELQGREFHRWLESAHPDLLKTYAERYGDANLGDLYAGRHLMATAGFLDDSWFNRTFWMYADVWPGWYLAHRGASTGQLLVIGPERTYAVQAYPTRNKQSPLFIPGETGYLLIADRNDTQPVLDDRTRGATKGIGYTRQEPPVWFDWVPIRIRAMVLAGTTLFVAGPPDVVDPGDPMASFEGRKGALLRAVSGGDGKTLNELRLPSPPVFDGLIASGDRLFMSSTNGQLLCLAVP